MVKYALTTIVGIVSSAEQIGEKLNNFSTKYNHHLLRPKPENEPTSLYVVGGLK
jgi:hypothetical protein